MITNKLDNIITGKLPDASFYSYYGRIRVRVSDHYQMVGTIRNETQPFDKMVFVFLGKTTDSNDISKYCRNISYELSIPVYAYIQETFHWSHIKATRKFLNSLTYENNILKLFKGRNTIDSEYFNLVTNTVNLEEYENKI